MHGIPQGGIHPPWISRGDYLFTWKWKLTVDPLYINCWSPPPGSTVSITSMSIIDCLYIDDWSAPPGSTVLIGSTLIASMLIIDHLYIDLPLPRSTVSTASALIASALTVNWPPLTFLIFNIRIVHSCIISFVCCITELNMKALTLIT